MEKIKLEQPVGKDTRIVFRVVICVLIIFFGIMGMKVLGGFKKPPAEVATKEIALQVEALRVEKKDYPVSITGYGEVRALNVVPIAPEVPGKIVEIHPRLEVGEIIPKGETLFKIDSRDYTIAVKSGRERLKFLRKNRNLAKKEYERVKRLFQENSVGTEAGVDMAEKAMLSSDDMIVQVEQALEMAEINLERCLVRAQFNGRVSHVALERGQFVSPGQNVLTLVDDSALEIQVPIDSRDAREWLLFENKNNRKNEWFSDLKKMRCSIRWTEGGKENIWQGILHRIVKFNRNTRTLTLAVRVLPEIENRKKTEALPIVAGMFCIVKIPGKMMHNVIRLPRSAVSFENTVFAAVNNRLKTIQVKVVRMKGEHIYISEGLEEGDTVLTTRLIDPLENTLLKIIYTNDAEVKS